MEGSYTYSERRGTMNGNPALCFYMMDDPIRNKGSDETVAIYAKQLPCMGEPRKTDFGNKIVKDKAEELQSNPHPWENEMYTCHVSLLI